jgi:cation transport regulator ChaC
MADYLFGYGALMEYGSRTKTEPSAVGLYPARVRGYQRGWFHRMDTVSFNTSFLGVVTAARECVVNGVIYRVGAIEETDARERGYTRRALLADEIESYVPGGGPDLEGGAVFIYVSDPASYHAVDPDTPIVQSYVDVCMNGAFQADYLLGTLGSTPPTFVERVNFVLSHAVPAIQHRFRLSASEATLLKSDAEAVFPAADFPDGVTPDAIPGFDAGQLAFLFTRKPVSNYAVKADDLSTSIFAKDFISATSEWSEHWVNDRDQPRRPFAVPNAGRIDEWLHRYVAHQFSKITIE